MEIISPVNQIILVSQLGFKFCEKGYAKESFHALMNI